MTKVTSTTEGPPLGALGTTRAMGGHPAGASGSKGPTQRMPQSETTVHGTLQGAPEPRVNVTGALQGAPGPSEAAPAPPAPDQRRSLSLTADMQYDVQPHHSASNLGIHVSDVANEDVP